MPNWMNCFVLFLNTLSLSNESNQSYNSLTDSISIIISIIISSHKGVSYSALLYVYSFFHCSEHFSDVVSVEPVPPHPTNLLFVKDLAVLDK